MTHPPNAPAVVVPMDPAMAQEPAMTIGKAFAARPMFKTFVSALMGVIATIAKITVDDAMIDNLTTIVIFASMGFSWLFAQWDAHQRAKAQATETRAAVYSPASVSAIVAAETPARDVEAVVIPAPPAQV